MYPLGVKANSLVEFSDKLRDVDLTSIKFHGERHDFENWVKFLSDFILFEQIPSLTKRRQTAEKLKAELLRIVKTRFNRLRKVAMFSYRRYLWSFAVLQFFGFSVRRAGPYA